ncbi:hypothetical protein Nepgr_021655 [Nepenthes gracilis]|uniref:Uncharacterized protein n=1 Tax=Nepenthes gracilis TaxID=150966 RepID=A0AAD3XX87_NEPGR|nr:hypothetical protein Nepgr_021655 [Nepenthes gracilis]
MVSYAAKNLGRLVATQIPSVCRLWIRARMAGLFFEPSSERSDDDLSDNRAIHGVDVWMMNACYPDPWVTWFPGEIALAGISDKFVADVLLCIIFFFGLASHRIALDIVAESQGSVRLVSFTARRLRKCRVWWVLYIVYSDTLRRGSFTLVSVITPMTSCSPPPVVFLAFVGSKDVRTAAASSIVQYGRDVDWSSHQTKHRFDNRDHLNDQGRLD